MQQQNNSKMAVSSKHPLRKSMSIQGKDNSFLEDSNAQVGTEESVNAIN